MSEFVTDNIDRLQLTALTTPPAWRLAFRSTNEGLVHQLYINGRLADAADTTTQCAFVVHAEPWPQELAVVAVEGMHRWRDFSDDLPANVAQPSWVYRTTVLREARHRPGDRLAVHHDDATATMRDEASLVREYWPRAMSHGGFGWEPFGRGAFGLDGQFAPGFGGGLFGLGPFGLETDLLPIDLPLTEEGAHQVELRTETSGGQTSQVVNDSFDAAPPPPPAVSLTAVGYDNETHELTFQINRG